MAWLQNWPNENVSFRLIPIQPFFFFLGSIILFGEGSYPCLGGTLHLTRSKSQIEGGVLTSPPCCLECTLKR